jgi:hypothetical protein
MIKMKGAVMIQMAILVQLGSIYEYVDRRIVNLLEYYDAVQSCARLGESWGVSGAA